MKILKLGKVEADDPVKVVTCKKCNSKLEVNKSDCHETDPLGIVHDGLKAYNFKCPVCRNFIDLDFD